MTPFEREALKWLQGLAVALASALVSYMSSAHPSFWGTVGLVVLTRIAGYGVAKIPVGAP